MTRTIHYTATGAIKKLMALRDDKSRQREQLDIDIRGLDVAIAALNGHATDAATAALPGKLDAAIAVTRRVAPVVNNGRVTRAQKTQRADLVRAFLNAHGPQPANAVRDHLAAHGFAYTTQGPVLNALADAGATATGQRGQHRRRWGLKKSTA